MVFLRRDSGLWKWSALIGTLLVGAFLRFYQLEYKSMWVDEIIQANLASEGFLETIRGMRTQVAAPPLDYLITWLTLQSGRNGVVTSEFVLRFPALAWGMLTIVLSYVLAKRITRSTLTAVVTAYLIALAPLLVRFSQEMRFYSLSVLTMVAFVYFVVCAWQTPNRKNWMLAVAALVVAFFTHYYVGLVLTALVVFIGGMVVVRLWRAGSIQFSNELRTRLKVGGGAILVLALVAVPWLIYALPSAAHLSWFEVSSLPELFGEPLTSGHVGGTSHLLAVRFLGLVAFPIVALVGLLVGLRRGRAWLLALALIVLIGGSGVVALDWSFNYFFTSRQLLFVVPFYVVLFAAGLVAIMQFVGRWNKLVGAALLVAALGGVSLVFGLSVRAYYDWPKDDWRSAARLLVNATKAYPAAIVTDPVSVRGYLTYYAPELGKYIYDADIYATSSEEESVRVWVVFFGTRVPPQLEILVANGWNTIYLNSSPTVTLIYAGRAPQEKLWNEIAQLDVPPQILIYSELLTKSRACQTPDSRLMVNARAALTPPNDPPLLDAQRSLLRRKLRLACKTN